MLSKLELLSLKSLMQADPSDPLNHERIAQILTSRIADKGEHARAVQFIVGLQIDLITHHLAAQDAAARQLYWGLMAALSAMGERIIDEAPDR